jgi:predicted NBD/HSP70 family sugar kinase
MIRNGRIKRSIWFRTDKDFMKQIKEISEFLRTDIPPKKIKAVSIGIAGPVKNNMLLEFPSLNIRKKIDVVRKLKKKIKQPIFIINDMKAAAWAELKYGIGRSVKNFYILTMSTSIGAGLVINGNVVKGFFGEFGHDVLDRKNNKDWGSLSGGGRIEILTKRKMKNLKIIRDYNAHGIGNMLNAFSVDRIVIMGSIGLKQFSKVMPSKNEIRKYTINKIPKIVKTKLGDNIGLLGAYAFATEKLKK